MDEPRPMVVTSFPPPPLPPPTTLAATLAPAPAMAMAMLAAPTSSANNFPKCMMYKSLLHEHIQKASLPMPIYQTVNEGSAHSPSFRAIVLVGEERFTSNMFLHRKEAEHDVARIALESLHKRIKEEWFWLIHESIVFCKSILNDYAVKRQLERPVYNTIQPDGPLPVFLSSLVFNGVTYTGANARSKKEAEQLAAQVAIRALIDDSTTSTVIFEILKSKSKFHAALTKQKDFHDADNKVPTTAISQGAPEVRPPHHAFGIPEEAVQKVSLDNNNVPIMAISQAAPEVHPPHHTFVTPAGKAEQEGIEVSPTVEQSSDPSDHPFVVPEGAVQEGSEVRIAFFVAPSISRCWSYFWKKVEEDLEKG